MQSTALDRQRMLLRYLCNPAPPDEVGADTAVTCMCRPDSAYVRQLRAALYKSRIARIRWALPRTCAAVWIEFSALLESFCKAHPPASSLSHEDAWTFISHLENWSKDSPYTPEYIVDLAKFEYALAAARTGRPLGSRNSSLRVNLQLAVVEFDLRPLFDPAFKGHPVSRRRSTMAIWCASKSGSLRIFEVPDQIHDALKRIVSGGEISTTDNLSAVEFLTAHDLLEPVT